MSPPDPHGSVWCCPASALLCWRGPMGAGLSQTQDGGVSAVQHASQPATMAEVVRERKRKMNGGLATLRRRLLAGGRRGARGGRSSRSGDRAAPLRDLLKEWSPLEVGALLEEYEALAALRDLCVQAELARPPAAALRGDLATLYDRRICPDAELVFKGTCFPVHRAVLSARCPYFRDLLNGYPTSGARVRLEAPLPPQVDPATVDGLLRYLYAGEPAPSPCAACDNEICDSAARSAGPNSVPDCCPAQADTLHSQHGGGGRLTLDIVGGGNICHRRPDPILLRRIASDLGATPSALHRDMRHLLDTAEYADASLVFTSEPPPSGLISGAQHPIETGIVTGAVPSFSRQGPIPRAGSPPSSSEYGFRPRLELPCHRAILSARSPFFRSVIQRRCRMQGNSNETFNSVKIVLDERVIPHKYARVLLHAVYTDQVDLNLIMRGGSSIFGCSLLGNHSSSLGEAQALANNQHNGNPISPHSSSPLEEAMELYEIGRFLELDILSQGCEDIIAERLSANSLATVLKWSAQPHGSKWVHRQALRYLREEFLTVAAGPALPQLEASHLAHALRCPFLQASELDALRATLRWGEHRLVKRMEDREPNLLSHTAHSVARKGVKKRDLSDAELRELLADLLPLVRIDHILPSNNELLNQAIRRGLVSSPPSYMLGDEGVGGSRADAWIRGKGGLYVRPRLYMPYYEEVKALLEDQMVQEAELMRMRRARYIPDIPDTLYMVSAEPRARSSASGAPAESPRGGNGPGEGDGSSNSGGLRGASGSAGNNDMNGSTVPPAPATMRAMLARERELRRAPASIRATSLPLSHTAEINRQIRLRVVREFNLPDSVADTLEGAAFALDNGSCSGRRSPPGADISTAHIREHCALDSNSHRPTSDGSRNGTNGDDLDLESEEVNGRCIQSSREGIDSWLNGSPNSNKRPLPSLLTEGESNSRSQPHDTNSRRQIASRPSQSGRGLSEAMPDVAMATSSLGRLRITTFGQQHSNLGFVRNSRTSTQNDTVEVEPTGNSFYSLSREPKIYNDSNNHSISHDGSTAHTPVSFMNPNQHLLQEGCGLGVFGYKGRDGTRKSQKHNNTSQQPSSSSGSQANQEGVQCQNAEGEAITSLQLDLGDGNQHSSPGRQSSGSQSPWSTSHNENRQHDRIRVLSATVSSDYNATQQQSCASPSNRANYSRYLSSQGTSQHVPFQSGPKVQQPLANGEEQDKSCSTSQSSITFPTSIPSSTTIAPASPFRISTGPLQMSINSNNTYLHSNGFSTLQHHSRSKSPRRVHGNSTLQRPQPLCPNTSLCTGSSIPCSTITTCSGTSTSCPGPSTPCPVITSSSLERDMHRSQSAGSVSSLGLDLDRRENKLGVQNVSGYNHSPSYGPSTFSSDASNQIVTTHNTPVSHSQLNHRESSPRQFRSISALPDQVAIYGESSSNSRNASYQLGANLIESTAHRNQFNVDAAPNWIQPGNFMSSDERNQLFLRNSRENFYNSSQVYPVQREGSIRTLSSSSPFQNENSSYSVRLDSPFACLQQNARPGSCGLADIMNVNTYNNSRGESPLYGAMNSASRGSSPFRTLDGTANQFSRGNSPYSSNHRMDFTARIHNENYCPVNVQRSSSPGCRVSYQSRNLSGSPSGTKMQSQQNSRTLSNSPSSGNFNTHSSISKTRAMAGSPTGSYPLLKQNSRTLSTSPSNTFNQGSSLKIHQSARTLSSSPSSSSSTMNFNQSSLKNQQTQRAISTSNSSGSGNKVDVFSGNAFCQQNSRDSTKSQTLRLSSSQYHVPGSGPPRFL